MNAETYNANLDELIQAYLDVNNATAQYVLINNGTLGEFSSIVEWQSTIAQPTPQQLMSVPNNARNRVNAHKNVLNNGTRLLRLTTSQINAVLPKLKQGMIFVDSDANKLCVCLSDGVLTTLP